MSIPPREPVMKFSLLPRFLIAVALAAAAVPRMAAAEFAMNVTAAGVTWAAHVSGPPLAGESVSNRVMLLEFWGVNCPPCLRSMPLLEELHRTLGPQGLVVVGAHAQGVTPDEIRAKVAELGVTFTIVDSASVEGGMDFEGIPHCMLFDHTGSCVYRAPFDVQAAVAAADLAQRCAAAANAADFGPAGGAP